MSCRYCKKFADKKTFPSEIYVLTSHGTNELPDESVQVSIFLDENIHERLDFPSIPAHYQRLKDWLVRRNGRKLHAISSTVALEHAHSTDNKRPRHALDVLLDINTSVLRGNKLNTQVISSVAGTTPLSIILAHGVEVLVGMVEIAWVRQKLAQAGHRDQAYQNCINFFDWRARALPRVDVYASTLLCAAALTGNSESQDCLKVNKKKATEYGKLLRNGAFDAAHLGQYLSVSGLNANLYPPQLCVFVTADKALAKFIRNPHFKQVGGQLVLAFEFNSPWVSRKDLVEVMNRYKACIKFAAGLSSRDVGRLAARAMYDIGQKDIPEFNRLWNQIVGEL